MNTHAQHNAHPTRTPAAHPTAHFTYATPHAFRLRNCPCSRLPGPPMPAPPAAPAPPSLPRQVHDEALWLELDSGGALRPYNPATTAECLAGAS